MSNRERRSSKDDPLITVALPVYNAGEFLELAVCSILKQSWTNWELLILDDGSTDSAIMRLDRFADPRIRVLCDGQNRGLSSRVNQAVAMAKGSYIARMDQDDICHPDRLAHQLKFLESHPEVDLLATQCVTMDERERIGGLLPFATEHALICRNPWKGFYMPHPSWMGRTEWFSKNRYLVPSPYCCEDQELLLRAHLSSCYHTLPERLLAYRLRSRVSFKKQWRTRLSVLEMQLAYFLSRREWVFAVQSFFMAVLRVGGDSYSQLLVCLLRPRENLSMSGLDSDENAEWVRYIKSLKVFSRSLGSVRG